MVQVKGDGALKRAGASSAVQLRAQAQASAPHRVQLRGMSFDEASAYLAAGSASRDVASLAPDAPVQAKATSGGLVQKKDTTKPVIDKLDAANIGRIVASLRGTATWTSAIATYKSLTGDGKDPLQGAAEDDLFLELLAAVEGMFSFAEGVSIDTLLDSPTARSALIGAVKKEATPAAPEKPAEPAKPKVTMPASGASGMVTGDAELTKSDGSKVKLAAGDVVESRGPGADGQLKVVVRSGKDLEGTIDPALFKAQPNISTNDDGKTEAHTYQKYVGKVFIGEPSVMDVDQGSLGDCFLIAGMGAVAAANPSVIKKAVKDNGDGTYTITFQELQKDGKTFKPHQETVDSYLPTRAGSGNRTAYAQSDAAFNPVSVALWPALVEKAYAQWKGGYTAIQDGGQAAKAMEALTGVKSVSSAMPAEKDVIPTFQKWQSEGKAVVCGTRDWIQQTSKSGLFSGAGAGPYTGSLTDAQGMSAEIVKGTVKISDGAGKGGNVRDDSKGKLTGPTVDGGTVAYDTGSTSLTFKAGTTPTAAADLTASYQFEGTLNQSLNVHGDHAYMFRAVQGDTLLFQNPWGPAASKHPKPMTAAQFREYFETIAVNASLPEK